MKSRQMEGGFSKGGLLAKEAYFLSFLSSPAPVTALTIADTIEMMIAPMKASPKVSTITPDPKTFMESQDAKFRNSALSTK